MSSSDPSNATTEALVRTIAEAVLRELDAAGGSPGGGALGVEPGGGMTLGWLLGAPMSHGAVLLREMAFLHRLGHGQRILCVPEARAALAAAAHVGAADVGAAGVALQAGQGVLSAVETVTLGEPGGASALLSSAAACEVLYVGALAWHQARALVAMDDQDPCVAVLLEALGAGRPVRVVTGSALGGLHRFGQQSAPLGQGGPDSVDVGGAVAREAARLWRGIAALGVASVSLEALTKPLAARAAAEGTFARALEGLVTEKDIDQAAEEGQRLLLLPGRTVVTPLARDRARALGVALQIGD